MRLTTSILLTSAIAVYDVVGQSTTSSAAVSSTAPVCGQEYSGYTISCGQTYSGNELQSSNSKRRREDWSLGRRNLKDIRATSQSSFEECISSCDDTSSCIAVSYISGQCALLSSVSGVTNADGAQAAIKSAQATDVLPSIGSVIISSVAQSVSASALAPNATTTSLSYQSELADYLAAKLSANHPTITGDGTAIYLPIAAQTAAPDTSAPLVESDQSSMKASTTTAPSKVKRVASTCSATNVASNIAVIKAAKPSPIIFCENWNAGKPHASSGFSNIKLPRGVSTACDCILSSYAASSTCAAASVQSNMAVVEANEGSSVTSFCQTWIANMPHSTSPFSAIKLALGVTNACKCILAGATVSATATSSALSTATTGAYVKNTGKRGLCYNDATLTQPFSRSGQNSQVSWGYNWYLSETSGKFNPDLMYIPLLYNNDSTLLSQWPSAAQSAIDNGATALFSFNEPDWCASGSSCMSVKSAVSTYKKYMDPFAGKALLGAPSVTNAGAPYGLTWLEEFIGNCTGCTIDFINLHWYSNKYAGATYFEEYVNSARSFGLPIYITEFGLDSTYSYTDAELQAFLEEVMPWMDQQDDILGYAYFMDEAGVLINSGGTGISGTGAVFNSYTNTTVQPDLY